MAENNRFRIVVALDLSEYAEIVLEHALDQAVRHDFPDLHFVTVVEPGSSPDGIKERLAALVLPNLEVFQQAGSDWRARLHVREGLAEEEMANLAGEIRAHLIVIGRFGVHDGNQLGSIASKVMQVATCPTLVVGLVDQSTDRFECSACAEVRTESDGERLFCEAHTGHRLISSSLTPTFTGGTLLW